MYRQDDPDDSPLAYELRRGCVDEVALLLHRGVDLFALDSCGDPFVYHVCQNIEYGPEDYDADTEIADYINISMFKLLVGFGLTSNFDCESGFTLKEWLAKLPGEMGIAVEGNYVNDVCSEAVALLEDDDYMSDTCGILGSCPLTLDDLITKVNHLLPLVSSSTYIEMISDWISANVSLFSAALDWIDDDDWQFRCIAVRAAAMSVVPLEDRLEIVRQGLQDNEATVRSEAQRAMRTLGD